MAKLKIELDENKIALIRNFKFKRINDATYGIDTYDLFGGTYLYEDMANILGWSDKVIPDTLENPMGALYEEEYQKKMEEYDAFLIENMLFIEEIIHQFITEGGLKPGIYTTLDYNRQWKYIPFEN